MNDYKPASNSSSASTTIIIAVVAGIFFLMLIMFVAAGTAAFVAFQRSTRTAQAAAVEARARARLEAERARQQMEEMHARIENQRDVLTGEMKGQVELEKSLLDKLDRVMAGDDAKATETKEARPPNWVLRLLADGTILLKEQVISQEDVISLISNQASVTPTSVLIQVVPDCPAVVVTKLVGALQAAKVTDVRLRTDDADPGPIESSDSQQEGERDSGSSKGDS